jgi:hypothetical protein
MVKSEKYNWMRDGVERPRDSDKKRIDLEVLDYVREHDKNPKGIILTQSQRERMHNILGNEKDLDYYRSLDRKKKSKKSKTKRKSKKKGCGCK